MEPLLVALCALLGLVTGTFLNAVIDRVPDRQRPWPLRPRCARCGTELPGVRPAVTRLVSRTAAACPSCGARLSARHAVVEIATATVFAAGAARFGADWVLPAYLVFFACLVAVTAIDLRHQIIPNRVVYPTIFLSLPLLGLAAAAQHGWRPLWHALLGGAIAFGMLLLVHLISPAGMGFGDVRLAFVLGLFLGWLSLGHVLMGLFLGFLLGAVVGLAQRLLGRRGLKDQIPFGPFLAGGASLAVLAGTPLMHWYLGR